MFFSAACLPNVCSRLASAFPEGQLPSMRVAGKVQGEDGGRMGDELGARTVMGQEGIRCRMPSEDVVLPGEDGRYLMAKACSVSHVSVALPQKPKPDASIGVVEK